MKRSLTIEYAADVVIKLPDQGKNDREKIDGVINLPLLFIRSAGITSGSRYIDETTAGAEPLTIPTGRTDLKVTHMSVQVADSSPYEASLEVYNFDKIENEAQRGQKVNLALPYSPGQISLQGGSNTSIAFTVPDGAPVNTTFYVSDSAEYHVSSNSGFNINIMSNSFYLRLATKLSFDEKAINGIGESIYSSPYINAKKLASIHDYDIGNYVDTLDTSNYQKLKAVPKDFFKDFINSNHEPMESSEAIYKAITKLESMIYNKFFHNAGITKFMCGDNMGKPSNIDKFGKLGTIPEDTLHHVMDFLTLEDVNSKIVPASMLASSSSTSYATSSIVAEDITTVGDALEAPVTYHL